MGVKTRHKKKTMTSGTKYPPYWENKGFDVGGFYSYARADKINIVSSKVQSMTDISSQGNNFTQADAARRPAYGSTKLNGISIADHNNDWLNFGATGANKFVDNTEGQTIFLVGEANDDETIFAKWDGPAGNRKWRVRANSYTVQSAGGGVNNDQLISFTNPGTTAAFTYVWEPSARCDVYVNNIYQGRSTSPANTTAAANEPTKMGATSNNASPLAPGKIAEILAYRKALSPRQIRKTVRWQQRRWL